MSWTTMTFMRRHWATVAVLAAACVVTPEAASPSQAAVLPHITPRVECRVPSTGAGVSDIVWFSYTSDATYRIPVGVLNNVTVGTLFGPGTRTNQVTHFLPGNQVMAFAVDVSEGSYAIWSVTQANTLAESSNPASTVIADTRNVTVPVCDARVPRVSAAISGVPVITATNGVQTRNVAGQLTAATVNFGVQGLSSVCTGTATPLTPLVLWGFGNGINVLETPPPLVVRNDILTVQAQVTFSIPFQRTWVPTVTIADPQQPFTNTLGEQYFGRARVEVIADVYGRCRGTDGVVYTAAIPFYVATDGTSTVFRWYSIGSPQTTTPIPITCFEFEVNPTVPGCPYNGGQTPTGGQRAKR